MNIVVWCGHCQRCGNPAMDEMDLYLAVNDDGTTCAELICKNSRLCQERKRARDRSHG